MITKNGFSISINNKKLGNIPSFSVPPILTCRADAPCQKDCYAVRMCKVRKTVRDSYNANYNALTGVNGYDNLIHDIDAFLDLYAVKLFRWNVAGDFFNEEYLDAVVKIAKNNPATRFLAYTKQDCIIEKYFMFHVKPNNLTIVLSNWLEWRCVNFHYLPTAEYVPNKEMLQSEHFKNGFVCGTLGNNCSECQYCWHMKQGDTVLFLKH